MCERKREKMLGREFVCLLICVTLSLRIGVAAGSEKCDPGYAGYPTCEICPENTFATGSESVCEPCPRKTKSQAGSANCNICLLGDIYIVSPDGCEALWERMTISPSHPSNTAASEIKDVQEENTGSIFGTLGIVGGLVLLSGMLLMTLIRGLRTSKDKPSYEIVVDPTLERDNVSGCSSEIGEVDINE